MQDFQMMLNSALNIFKTPVTIYGFTFNFWQVFLWSLVAGLVIWFINNAFD